MDYIFVINDEFGYWLHAVSAVGYDWKDLIAETPYYSWGYSLWLVPIVAILPTPELWYKAAILLNVLFLIMSYFLCYKSGKKLFADIDEKVIALISLIVIIYPANIVYAQATWTESLLYSLVWLETYLLISLDEKFSAKKYVLAIIVLLYSYAVHNRSMGVVLAGIIALVLALVKHKKKLGYYLSLFLILLVGYKGIELVKAHQINLLWSNSKNSGINNVGLNVQTVTNYYSRIFEQTKNLLISFAGKYFYLIIGSCLTLPIAVVGMLKELIDNIRSRKLWNNYQLSKIWIILVAGFMYGISVIQMNNWTARKDYVVYGRYMENGIGPILFLALIYCISLVKETRIGLGISLLSLLLGVWPVYLLVSNAAGWFNTICSPVIGAFYEAVSDMRLTFIILVMISIVIFVIIFASTFPKRKKWMTGMALICIGLTFTSMGYHASQYAILKNRQPKDSVTVPLRSKISGELAEEKIYFVKNDGLDWTSLCPKYFQFLIPDRAIHVILQEEIEQVMEEDCIIMMNPRDEEAITILEDSEDAEVIDMSDMMVVYFVDVE
ncbi:MAG: hypothetical protein ACI4C4_01090 [Lachnospiraceae bacterium]